MLSNEYVQFSGMQTRDMTVNLKIVSLVKNRPTADPGSCLVETSSFVLAK